MHILIGFLGALVSLFYLLDRLGIDIGGFNPFHWRRKRAWLKQYHGDPINSIEEPLHVAALLILGAAKLDGTVSAEQKRVALQRFEAVFSLDAGEASELVGSAIHLLTAPQLIDAQLQGLANKNKHCFTEDQIASMLQLMVEIVSADGEVTAPQSEFIQKMRTHFTPLQQNQGTWA